MINCSLVPRPLQYVRLFVWTAMCVYVGVASSPGPSSPWGGEGPGDEATSHPAHVERAFSYGESLENEATVYLFFSFASCGSKEREESLGTGLENFIDENPIDDFLPLTAEGHIVH